MARCGLWTSFALGWMGSVCRVFEATEVSRTIPLAAEKAVSLLRLGGGSNIDDFPALGRVEMTKPRVLPKLSGRRRALKFVLDLARLIQERGRTRSLGHSKTRRDACRIVSWQVADMDPFWVGKDGKFWGKVRWVKMDELHPWALKKKSLRASAGFV